jgi:hypothetical protein
LVLPAQGNALKREIHNLMRFGPTAHGSPTAPDITRRTGWPGGPKPEMRPESPGGLW